MKLLLRSKKVALALRVSVIVLLMSCAIALLIYFHHLLRAAHQPEWFGSIGFLFIVFSLFSFLKLWDDRYRVVLILREQEAMLEKMRDEFDLAHLITQRKENQWRKLLQGTSDGFCVVNFNGTFLDANDTFCGLAGYTKEELQSLSFDQFENPDSRGRFKMYLERIAERGSTHFESTLQHKSGKQFDLEVTMCHAEEEQVFLFVRDITERRLMQNALRKQAEDAERRVQELNDTRRALMNMLDDIQQERQKAESLRTLAERASKTKSEFLANMSHEIRTPMNAVIGFADILKKTTLDDTQREYVNIIADSGDVLINLINDILDVSKIESG